MENKILIKLSFPELDLRYDVFIPVNELVWKIKKIIIKSISDISGIPLNINDEYIMLNKETGTIYDNNEIIINTNIRNNSEIMMLSTVK